MLRGQMTKHLELSSRNDLAVEIKISDLRFSHSGAAFEQWSNVINKLNINTILKKQKNKIQKYSQQYFVLLTFPTIATLIPLFTTTKGEVFTLSFFFGYIASHLDWAR